jgi:regulator of replication initiation timing
MAEIPGNLLQVWGSLSALRSQVIDLEKENHRLRMEFSTLAARVLTLESHTEFEHRVIT